MERDRVVLLLFESFPHSKATERTVEIYDRALSEIPVDELQVVIEQCIRNCKFLPTVAEIFDVHRSLTSGESLTDTAAQQWEQVKKAIREVGHWGTPNFTNPITKSVVNSIGWQELCMSENQMADRAHFLKMYQEIAGRAEQVGKLTPAARQLAEKRGGLKSIKELVGLPGENVARGLD